MDDEHAMGMKGVAALLAKHGFQRTTAHLAAAWRYLQVKHLKGQEVVSFDGYLKLVAGPRYWVDSTVSATPYP